MIFDYKSLLVIIFKNNRMFRTVHKGVFCDNLKELLDLDSFLPPGGQFVLWINQSNLIFPNFLSIFFWHSSSTLSHFCRVSDLVASFMLLACHKKSCLICDEIMNFRIFTKPIPNYFFKVQNWDNKTGQTQLLENK